MNKKQNELLVKGLQGIEGTLTIIFLFALYHLGYKVEFWIFTAVAFIGICIQSYQIVKVFKK